MLEIERETEVLLHFSFESIKFLSLAILRRSEATLISNLDRKSKQLYDYLQKAVEVIRNLVTSAVCISHRSTAASRSENEHCVESTDARIPIGMVSFRATWP